jgi:tRNA uracil 4-sulfurtransferase
MIGRAGAGVTCPPGVSAAARRGYLRKGARRTVRRAIEGMWRMEEQDGAGAIAGSAERIVLVRLGAELTIKSRRTRSSFLRRLHRNIGDALTRAEIAHRIEAGWSRFFVHVDSPAALPVLARVFGISSISPVERVVPSDLDAIVQAGRDVFAPHVAGRRFAVRARRAGQHAFRSRDVEVRLGAALLPHAAGVDLDDPEVTAGVEVRERETYLFSERIPGAGGLPLGVEGRAVALLSGGYDSAVASWLMLKRGVELDYVFCNLGGEAYERAVVQVAKLLTDDWSAGYAPRLHVVDFGDPLRELRARVKPSYWQLVLKRMMYRVASAIGRRRRAAAIVTGEAIGQVSSQTLQNLHVLDDAADLPLFRPLLGFDKEEIIERAVHIGSAALSERVKEYCAIAPGRPVTAADPARVAEQDAHIDPAVLHEAVRTRRVLDLRALQPADLVEPYLFTTEIPDGAVVLDCRPLQQYRAWHFPGAQHRDELELLRGFRRLDREPTYVLYCAHGIQTAYIAEKMQREGYEAYSVRGGLRGVLRAAEQRGLQLDLMR